MNFKDEMINSAEQAIDFIKQDGTQNVYQDHPSAIIISGMANYSYYIKATHQNNDVLDLGLYPIQNPAIDLTGDTKKDAVSPKRAIQTLKNAVTQMKALTSQDVKDMYEASTDMIAGSTSSQWTADHIYSTEK